MEVSEMYHDEEDIDKWRNQQKQVNKQINNMSETKTEEKKGSRYAYGKVAIVGTSGSGKSYIAKTLDPETTGYINVERKPLPFKLDKVFKHLGQPKTWAGFIQNLKDYVANPAVKKIFLDSQTAALDILNREMQTNFTGWDIPKYYARAVYEYLELMKGIEKDMIILSHDELVKLDDKSSQKRMVVHNKEYEGKLERQYTCVLYTGTKIKEGKPQYFLKTFELDSSSKTPEGLFPDKDGNNLLEIPNDGKYIFECIEKYYTV